MELQPAPVRNVNVVILNNGKEIAVDDIASTKQGVVILDDLDAAILAIEDEMARMKVGGLIDPDRYRRHERALKIKRRLRPRLQARIGALGRTEKAAALAGTQTAVASKVDAKRQAFIHAAYELLGHETCVEVWARAQEKQPALFADGGVS